VVSCKEAFCRTLVITQQTVDNDRSSFFPPSVRTTLGDRADSLFFVICGSDLAFV